MSVNRSILKKSRHIGIGLLQFNPSTKCPHNGGVPVSNVPVSFYILRPWCGISNKWCVPICTVPSLTTLNITAIDMASNLVPALSRSISPWSGLGNYRSGTHRKSKEQKIHGEASSLRSYYGGLRYFHTRVYETVNGTCYRSSKFWKANVNNKSTNVHFQPPPAPPSPAPCLTLVRTNHRVVTSAFWRTFSHEGKISLGCWGWGVHAHPPFITFTITRKVAVYAPAEWENTLTLFHLLWRYVLCGANIPYMHQRISILRELQAKSSGWG